MTTETVIDSVTQVITSIGVIFAVVTAWHNGRHIDEVHKAVNSTAMDQNQRTDQLTASLTAAGVDVPARQSPPEGEQK